MFVLPDLPYGYDALAPVISDRTMQFHHDKHHKAYVDNTNNALANAANKPDSLEAVIQQARTAGDKRLFNNSAQSWNHAFFWVAMAPGAGKPDGDLAAAITAAFGDLAGLKTKFVDEGVGHFGSGWVWLVSEAGKLAVRSTHDAEDMATHSGVTPLLVCDVWEHAYYLDHQNNRKGFLEAWFDALPNWKLAASQLGAANGQGSAWRYPAPT